jgi:hypothetical protein
MARSAKNGTNRSADTGNEDVRRWPDARIFCRSTGIPVEKYLPAVYIGAGIRAKNKPKNNRFGKEKRK